MSLGSDGNVIEQGPISDILQLESSFIEELEEGKLLSTEFNPKPGDKENTKAGGKLVAAEEMAEGSVTWSARK
jgi:hypothetical protein